MSAAGNVDLEFVLQTLGERFLDLHGSIFFPLSPARGRVIVNVTTPAECLCVSSEILRHDSASAWCGRRDSNPHNFRHWNLNPARLPIPPRPQSMHSGSMPRCGGRITWPIGLRSKKMASGDLSTMGCDSPVAGQASRKMVRIGHDLCSLLHRPPALLASFGAALVLRRAAAGAGANGAGAGGRAPARSCSSPGNRRHRLAAGRRPDRDRFGSNAARPSM